MDRERLKRDVERIEKHREEKAAVAKSEREIFADLKGDGFNCKVVREILKRRGMDDSDGWDAEVATYEAAVHGIVQAAAEVRSGGSIRKAAARHEVNPSDVHRHLQATTAAPETQNLEQSEVEEVDFQGDAAGRRGPLSFPAEQSVNAGPPTGQEPHHSISQGEQPGTNPDAGPMPAFLRRATA